ncbi:P-loop containing nucleoside triphosphate hydrolase protein [Mycena latifolia]|nr:P-loop containing nucleoside triphosphate hydrolase protein [Mycena latifolia]
MPRVLRWQDAIGRQTMNKIVKKLVPEWKDGLRPVQEDLISAMLDGDDILCCTATGDGKSGAFSVPILVLNEYNNHRELYPAVLPTRLNPVGMVVTPTKGLAANIVLELARMKVSGFAYCREALADARRQGINLADEIKNCTKWQVICVDPEHLKTKEWRDISESPIFRSRIFYAATDEAHLINEWGILFRIDFRTIGLFLRGRLPSSISIVGLSATLAPGKDTTAVCQTLGLFEGHFHMIRRTNERPNIQFTLQTLTHGLSGYEFPDILPFLRSGRKVIIHFHSLDMLFRCYVYIWRLQPRSAEKMRRTRMYHSLCSPEYNEETIRRIDEDPYCQIVLATIAFSNGINAKAILDSVSLGFSSTVDIVWQEKGRAGRAAGTIARGVVLVQKSTIKTAEKYLHSLSAPPQPNLKKKRGGRKQKTTESMNLIKAQLLTETHCYVACLNRHYQNPPVETSTLDCLTAKRTLPCSLCLTRSKQTLKFPAPLSTPAFPALTESTTRSKTRSSGTKKLKLTRKERDVAKPPLTKFLNSIRCQEQKRGKFLEHPQTMFLPSSIQTIILDNLLSISSLSDLQSLIRAWRHLEHHSSALYEVILDIQNEITEERELAREARNTAAREKRAEKRKAAVLEDSTEEEGDDEEDSDESDFSPPETIQLPAKSTRSRKETPSKSTGARKALASVTNRQH